MSFSEFKLAELSSRNATLGQLKDYDKVSQEQIIKDLIKEHNEEIKAIRDNQDSYSYDDANKKILNVEAKHRIRILNEEVRIFNTYLRHLKGEANKTETLNKRKRQQLFIEKKIRLNQKQQCILDNLLKNGSIDSNNIVDVIKVWEYLVDEKLFVDNDKEIYQITKFINDFNLNATSDKRKKYELELGKLKGIITKIFKQYPKKTPERRLLKSYRKFVKSIIKFNKEEEKQSYDYRYDIMDYFLNDADGFIYLQRLFKYDPELFSIRDRNGIHIFNNILAKYIECYKKELVNHEKLIIRKEYYEKIIELFVKENNFKFNEEDQNLFEAMQQDFQDYLKTSNFKRDIVLNALYAIRNIMTVKENTNYYQKEIEIDATLANEDLPTQLKNLNIVRNIACDNKKRKMFGNEIYTFMIDNVDSAYSIAYSLNYTTSGHLLLSVHTPDIEAIIPEDSALDIDLYNKMFSKNNDEALFSDEILANLKLNLKRINPCITYQVELRDNGKVGNSIFLKSNVIVTECIKREDLNDGKLNDKLKPFIQTSYVFDPETQYSSLAARIETTYEKVINYAVGCKFEENKLPYLYTNKLTQDSNKYIEMMSNFNYIFSKIPDKDFIEIYKIIRDDINDAYYDVKNMGHSELNFKYKSDILNPLNSYLGIVLQRLVNMFFIDKIYSEKDKMNALLNLLQIKEYANYVKSQIKSQKIKKLK